MNLCLMPIVCGLKQPTITEFPMNRIIKSKDAPSSGQSIEALEYAYPFLVKEYAIRRGSGGKGSFHGGDGIIREIELLSDAEVTILSDRRRMPPYGLAGGKPGKVGRNLVIKDGIISKRPGKFSEQLKKGDSLRIESPGGGGYGVKSGAS